MKRIGDDQIRAVAFDLPEGFVEVARGSTDGEAGDRQKNAGQSDPRELDRLDDQDLMSTDRRGAPFCSHGEPQPRQPYG